MKAARGEDTLSTGGVSGDRTEERPAPGLGGVNHGLLAALLVLLVAVAFFPAVSNGFSHHDDVDNFTANGGYRGLHWENLRWAWKTTLLGVYQPVAWMLLSVEYCLWGVNPRGYHFASVLLQAVNALALYALTLSVLGRSSPGDLRTMRIPAALAAALFAVHPQRVEVVAWASCQPYLPCALFSVLSVLTYLRANEPGRPYKLGYLVSSLLLFWASLLCKAPSVTLPMLLVILDIYPLRRLGGRGRWFGPQARQAWAEKVPFFAISFWFVLLGLKIRGPNPQFDPPGLFGPAARVVHACHSLLFYPSKAVLPLGLTSHYATPQAARPTDPIFLVSLVTVVTVTAGLVLIRRRWPGLLATWAAYGAILTPCSGILSYGHSYIAADRYSYLAMMAWTPLVAVCLHRVMRRRWSAAGFVGLGLLAGLAGLTRAQCRIWQDPVTLWRDAHDHGGRQSWLVQNNLGLVLANRGQYEEAVDHFSEAARINPEFAPAIFNAAVALELQGHLEKALDHYARAVQMMPVDFRCRIIYCRLLTDCGELDEALAQYHAMGRIWPRRAEVYLGLGRVFAERGDLDGAIAQYSQAVQLAPAYTEARSSLEAAQEAKRRKAQETDPGHQRPGHTDSPNRPSTG
jgi:hypothetical protein